MTWLPVDAFSLANLHVAEGTRRCDLQRALISHLRVSGRDTAVAEALLVSFEETLGFMREHQRRLSSMGEQP
ncbi:hypothetical protein [Methylobacterium nigriterrae]|uniref:hypothetical protein n=1 Tax=Methylobacterium nigriterrae TaxID=3127512 RepID=UPI003013E012